MSKESYTFKSVDLNSDRTELHDLLNLTGCEVSINNMAPNTQAPFFHYHKENEEVYVVLEGSAFIHRLTDGAILNTDPFSTFIVSPSAYTKPEPSNTTYTSSFSLW